MSMFTAAVAAKTAVKASTTGPSQVVQKTTINLDDLEQLADALEANGFKLHEAGIRNAGLAPTGEPMVALSCQRKVGGKTATVSTYYNGTTVWAGIEPVDFKKTAKPRKPSTAPSAP